MTRTCSCASETVQPRLKLHFKRDEFLGRINQMVVFHPFNDRDLAAIVGLELQSWSRKAEQRHEMQLTWTAKVVAGLSKKGNARMHAQYNARN
jgi:ATP-dependent Clp protease ATP-binding subunit ClpB